MYKESFFLAIYPVCSLFTAGPLCKYWGHSKKGLTDTSQLCFSPPLFLPYFCLRRRLPYSYYFITWLIILWESRTNPYGVCVCMCVSDGGGGGVWFPCNKCNNSMHSRHFYSWIGQGLAWISGPHLGQSHTTSPMIKSMKLHSERKGWRSYGIASVCHLCAGNIVIPKVFFIMSNITGK